MSTNLERTAQEAVAALQALRQSAFLEATGRQPPAADKRPFELTWQPGMASGDLAEQAMRAAMEEAASNAPYREGRVYCYACRNADCDHAAPPEPGTVFAGYQSTGRPEWLEFFNYLLHLGDSRTDLLFAERPELLARVIGRGRLTLHQLASFGKNALTYRIWGQVVAGYLHVSTSRNAITVQVVETRDRRLRLQVLTSDDLRDALANAPDDRRHAHHRVYDALSEARHSINALSSVWQANPTQKAEKKIRDCAFSTLRHLAHSVERKGRQHQRRTTHAEMRARQKRPVHKALDDLKQATADDIHEDTVRDSIVVLGKGGRLHAFTRDGRHITSLTVRGDVLERRRQRKRYVPLSDSDREIFCRHARASLTGENREGRP